MSGGDEPTAGRFEGLEHRLPIRVYYEDTDFTGLVYHASYLRFFERGRSDVLRLAGADHCAMAAAGAAFAVTRMALDFRGAARIDDALQVFSRILDFTGARLRFAQSIRREGALLTEAEVEVACIDARGRARRPPAALRAALAPYLPRQT